MKAKNLVRMAFVTTMVVINLSLWLIIAYSLVAYLILIPLFFLSPEVEQPLEQISFGDTDVILTCIATHSGPIILTLKSCPVDKAKVCKEIGTVYESGIPCQEYTLERNVSTITIVTTSGSMLRAYTVDELGLDDK